MGTTVCDTHPRCVDVLCVCVLGGAGGGQVMTRNYASTHLPHSLTHLTQPYPPTPPPNTPGPLSRAEFSNVILSGFQLPAPGSRPHGLIPTGLSTSFLSLQDVRILVNAAALQQHLDFFTAAAPNVTFYTVSRRSLQTPAAECVTYALACCCGLHVWVYKHCPMLPASYC